MKKVGIWKGNLETWEERWEERKKEQGGGKRKREKETKKNSLQAVSVNKTHRATLFLDILTAETIYPLTFDSFLKF